MVIPLLQKWFTEGRLPQAVLMGILLGIGFIVPSLWWISVVALVWSLHALKTSTSYGQAIKLFLLVWWIKSLCSLSWYVSTYPINWLGIENHTYQIILVGVYWFTSSLWLALGGIILALVGRFLFLHNYVPEVVWYCSMPLLWVLCELISGLTFALFSYGPGSIVDFYFVSFGMVGYLLGTSSLGVWLASVKGVYGLSFILVSTACLMLLLIETKRIKCLTLFFIVVAILSVWSSQRQLLYTNLGVTVVSVDTQFDAILLNYKEGEQIKVDTIRIAIDQAVELAPTFVLLPEDSRYLYSQYNSLYPDQAMSMFLFTHKNTETILIDSGRHVTENGATVLRANVFDGVSKKMWQFDKQYLVPQGEYIPYLYQTVFSILGFKSSVEEIAKDSAYRPGPLLQTSSLPAYIPGVLFCFESISPTGVPKLEQSRRVPFVAHPISHTWFHDSVVLGQQLDVMLQLQARYSGVPIVSAGNMAIGKLYLPNGVIESGRVIRKGERYQLREFKF